MKRRIILGSRASKLAIAQSLFVKNKLESLNINLDIEIKEIVTSGDINYNIPGENRSLKGEFIKEIEEAILKNDVDFAVHSMKDMPTDSTYNLIYAAIPDRADYRDVLVSKTSKKLMELPKGAVIGTTSLRRKSALLSIRNDIIVKPIRGNVHTRIKKMEDGLYDALILAAAGLKRVDLDDKITEYFDIDSIMPAPAQGALCIQCRNDDHEIINILKRIENPTVREQVEIEREFAMFLDSGCHSPVGSYAKLHGGKITLYGSYFYEERIYKAEITCAIEERNYAAGRLYTVIKKLMGEDINYETNQKDEIY